MLRETSKLNLRNMVFYIECQEKVNETEYHKFLIDSSDDGKTISEDLKKRIFLLEYNDVDGFVTAVYINYLYT